MTLRPTGIIAFVVGLAAIAATVSMLLQSKRKVVEPSGTQAMVQTGQTGPAAEVESSAPLYPKAPTRLSRDKVDATREAIRLARQRRIESKPPPSLPSSATTQDGDADSDAPIDGQHQMTAEEQTFVGYVRETMQEVGGIIRDSCSQYLPASGTTLELRPKFAVAGEPEVAGLIEEFNLENDGGASPEMKKCIENAFTDVVFPAPLHGGKVTIIYPIAFRAGTEQAPE